MRHIQTEVLVIGGGATGTGILRDLAMRGFKCALVERRDLAYGTTGRYHGLLHSGGRYVVKDPIAAQECYAENIILKRIMPQCIEDTGGFFVLTEHDDPDYVPQFISGCKNSGIPVEEISVHSMITDEPLLSPKIQRCFRVPDASADSFLATDLNSSSARQYGALVFPYHEVHKLLIDTESNILGRSITGVICQDLIKDEEVQFEADIIINSSGPWAGKIAAMAGISLKMMPGKGTMVALNHRIVNTVINRCKLPSDGDILVPAHTVAVMGTTDIRVADPNQYSIEPWEIRLMLDEGEKLIPTFKEFRILRAWAGVRPLVQETVSDFNRDVSRSFLLLDHSIRDGVNGFITITGGKWTTYRKMAQVTVDKVCEKVDTNRQCKTHLEKLPFLQENKLTGYFVGSPLKEIERDRNYGKLVCECELATQEEVEQAIINNNSITIDDIRRDVRLGMGPCQAAFCGLRAAGIIHNLRHPKVNETNQSLQNFLEERWKGNLPILWGQQLRQERFNELIYINNLNVNDLPVVGHSSFSPEPYTTPIAEDLRIPEKLEQGLPNTLTSFSHKADVVVIGSGLSGLVASWRLGLSGKKVQLITKGWGTTYWSSGCIDVLGYQPPNFSHLLHSPNQYLEDLVINNPNHPYAIVGLETVNEALQSFIKLSEEYGYPYQGSLDQNIFLPTALGTLRPTCLAPISMIAGDASQRSPMLIVGFTQFLDFYPELIAANLNEKGLFARAYSLDIHTLNKRRFVFSSDLARLFDDPAFRQEVIDELRAHLGNAHRIGFPAVLGLKKHPEVIEHLELALERKVFEIPGLPPSIPGIRLHNMLASTIENLNGSVLNGMLVTSSINDGGHINAVISVAASRQLAHQAEDYILATGGILGGGIAANEDGYAKDTVFSLPIDIPKSRTQWHQPKFLSRESHPIFTKGLRVNSSMQPVDQDNQVIYNNLFTVGSMIGDCDPIRERSIEGIALVTGFKAAQLVSSKF